MRFLCDLTISFSSPLRPNWERIAKWSHELEALVFGLYQGEIGGWRGMEKKGKKDGEESQLMLTMVSCCSSPLGPREEHPHEFKLRRWFRFSHSTAPQNNIFFVFLWSLVSGLALSALRPILPHMYAHRGPRCFMIFIIAWPWTLYKWLLLL